MPAGGGLPTGEPLPIGPNADPFQGGMQGSTLTDPFNAQDEFQRKKMMAMRPYLGV
jgi:hypothetical protein